MAEILWEPGPEQLERSHLASFMRLTTGNRTSYDELWRWSVDEPADFWERVWQYCRVEAARPYTEVMSEPRMPGTAWFSGSYLSFPANLLRRDDDAPAIYAAAEGRPDETVTWRQLVELVGKAEQGLRALGVERGDRVAALLPNCVEAVVAMLATTALGAIWSSCSPDFGATGIVDRFAQIRPKVLLTADGYRYNGAAHALQDKVAAVCRGLPELQHVVVIDFTGVRIDVRHVASSTWRALCDHRQRRPEFAAEPFDHPLYIMYSSGTTGPPKSIVHGAGGTLLKHVCEHQLHTDLHRGDVLFWFTTCGWMMWNWLVGALASETTIVLYDGSPTADGFETLWALAERAGVTHFGTSPKFLAANEKAGVTPSEVAGLGRMRALLSTGAPLNPEQFDWVYDQVKGDVQLASISGGTDIIGCFALGAPILPVRRGELQCLGLGMSVEAWDEHGRSVVGEKGELVCTKPFPSMPIGFWDDPDGERYRQAYFTQNPGVWTHGDFIEIRRHGGVVIYGRSDTTLNPGGVRIGTAEIYRAVEPMPEVADAIAAGLPADGDVDVVLCVQPAAGVDLDDTLVRRIKERIREATTPRHVPRHVFAVDAIPYTISGKKVEKAVAMAIAGEPVANRDALANPECLGQYARLPFPD